MRSAQLWPVLRMVALILHVPAAMGAVSVAVALLAGEAEAAWAFAGTAVGGAVAAQVLLRLPRGHRANVRETMVGAALGWLALALVGAVPLLWVGLAAPPGSAAATYGTVSNALFEAMSGFTTTGLTVIEHPSALPDSLLWWRSFMQWIGGGGIIVMVLTVLHTEHEAGILFHAEVSNQTVEHDLFLTIRYIWWVYLSYTVAAVLLLWAVGMSPWHALIYGLAGIATGGFAATDGSLADFGPVVQVAMLCIVVTGALSFITHVSLFRRDWQVLRRDVQIRALAVLLPVGVCVILAILWHESGRLLVMDATFQTVSAFVTAGFNTTDVGGWSMSAQLFLVIGMLIGGAAGSTAGGIKLSRFVTLAETLWGYVTRIALEPHKFVYRPGELPSEVLPGFSGRIAVAVLLLVLTLAAVIVGSWLLFFVTPAEVSFSAVIFDVVSAMSLVGMSAGVAGPDLHWIGKAVLIVLMWMGRLEILPVLVVIAWLAAPAGDGRKAPPAKGKRKAGTKKSGADAKRKKGTPAQGKSKAGTGRKTPAKTRSGRSKGGGSKGGK